MSRLKCLAITGCTTAIVLGFVALANATTINNNFTFASPFVPAGGGSSALNISAPRTSATISGSNAAGPTSYRAIAVDFVYWNDGAGAATDVEMQCYGTSEYSTNSFNLNKLFAQVITSTSSTGLSPTSTSTWSQSVSGSCVQVSSTLQSNCAWTWILSNVVWPTVTCIVSGTGANTHDFVYSTYRFVTP